MTLLVCVHGSDGLVLATDSRGTFGDPRSVTAQNDNQKKLFRVNDNVGVMTAGAGELAANLMREVQPQLDASLDKGVTAIMSALRVGTIRLYDQWFSGFAIQPIPGIDRPLRPDLQMIVAGYDLDGAGARDEAKIYSLAAQINFAPLQHDYGFALQGIPQYALYLLNRLHEDGQPASKLESLAAYVITETASQDGKVGGPVQMAVITKTNGYIQRTPDQVREVVDLNQEIGTALREAFYGEATDGES